MCTPWWCVGKLQQQNSHFTKWSTLCNLAGGDVSEPACSYQDVLDHLNLTRSNELYIMTRPVRNYKQRTQVSLEVLLYAILDVVEKEQKFIPYVQTATRWRNDYISWDPQEFCGIDNVSLPAEVLWKPDLTIEEMTEKDKAPPTPYVTISANGFVEVHYDQVLVCTCRMHIYKFPFDTQRCNLTFKSVIHTAKDLLLKASDNSSEASESSRELMRTQYEWVFLNMNVTAYNASVDSDQDKIVYTITMRRKPILYIVNFVLPVLFFLGLDLASFLISDRAGEKLSFKITVLLAVTVLQLILNEILPSSTNRIPLIGVYCIGIFALMLLSLLETICVMRLMQIDNKSDNHADGEENGGFSKHANFYNGGVQDCGGIYSMSASEALNATLPGARESQSGVLCQTLEKLSDELKAMERTLRLLHGGHKEELGYWSRLARNINRVFFIFYVTLVVLFLTLLFTKWTSD
ncbi:5-hydroxytryptamine receptor 3A-like isoform X2 [Entelurus aequoreus]|uniref:5-hydroxytryptamine receptor 3A-like isoform X2 n=1 Tax=Entelurus aequoreus TaxID=161455 RepID=UPI002B1E08C6|nr:5-hydroxytryptamine receptor 3A-like isoform X2 [Entelurus aequoreus]